ncbi:MAG: isoprenyl transferase [Desulfobacteraceae bacterium]|nr:MAG: isoprenyl transferase [Desulfobacteraceae bacterium]
MKSNNHQDLGLNPDTLPAHVAIIMDGNGRWAKQRMMNRVKGHEKGSETVRTIVTACRELGISNLTLYAFSTENWERPKAEVKALMSLLKKFIISERAELLEKGIRFNVIGQKHRLPEDVQAEINTTMRVTASNTAMTLNLALSYGAREEITTAVKSIAQKVKSGMISPDKVTTQSISDHLYTSNLPDPDLLIRTSGEYRISNFLLWQIAYAEIYISQTFWPDFTRQEFIEILKNYQQRDRRFGKV